MTSCIFRGRISSLEGAMNMKQIVDSILDCGYNEEMLLEPKDGLKYYEYKEKILFDECSLCELTKEDLSSLRIDIPNPIIDKCCLILNEKCNKKMHCMYLNISLNEYKFIEMSDDIQIIT